MSWLSPLFSQGWSIYLAKNSLVRGSSEEKLQKISREGRSLRCSVFIFCFCRFSASAAFLLCCFSAFLLFVILFNIMLLQLFSFCCFCWFSAFLLFVFFSALFFCRFSASAAFFFCCFCAFLLFVFVFCSLVLLLCCFGSCFPFAFAAFCFVYFC